VPPFVQALFSPSVYQALSFEYVISLLYAEKLYVNFAELYHLSPWPNNKGLLYLNVITGYSTCL